MKGFARFIGRLPLVGKIAIKSLVFDLYQAATSEEKRGSYLKLAALLTLSILFHTVQMKMGISALEFNSPIWVKGVSALMP